MGAPKASTSTTASPSALEKLRNHPLLRDAFAGRGLPPRLHLLLGLGIPMWILIWNMWRVHWFTYDDAYISYRYAVNLVGGHGLVYNPGERVEGYTNFLWTLIVAGGLQLGIDPDVTSKVLGAAASIGTMVVVYRLSCRLQPFGTLPCIATWLLASSSTFTGYAVFGLETNAFVFLVLLGTSMMFKEEERGQGFPWSGLVFALAGLTRPEAPMYIGIPMLALGRRFFGKQNLIRGIVFAAPLVVHLLWRHSYYGTWLPATLGAKTGDIKQQYNGGRGYILAWVEHAGPIVFASLYGFGLGLARRHRQLLSLSGVFVGVLVYILLVGGDWMSYFRFLAPAEPFCFLLVCVALRDIIDKHSLASFVAVALFLVFVGFQRVDHLGDAQRKWKEEKRFWENAAGQAAEWLATNAKPGRVAIGDIGWVGYRTNYPILDLLGLVDPVIADLPGGYTKKLGKGFKERFFEVMPEYAVIIMAGLDCKDAQMKGSRLIHDDRRFRRNYAVAHNIQVISGAGWCIFKRKDF